MLLFLQWCRHELKQFMCWGTRTFPLLFVTQMGRTTWMGTEAWTLLEKDFFGYPAASENSYYCLIVLPLYKSCCRGIWRKVKMSLSRIVACNIAQRNCSWRGISGKLHKTKQTLLKQTLLKAPLTMAPILCSVPLTGAESTYILTADCTAEVFSRLVCSVQMMEVSNALHKQIWWQQNSSTWWHKCAPPSPRSLLMPLEDRAPVQEQLTLAMFLSTTGDSLKAAKKKKKSMLVFKVRTASQGAKRGRPLLWLSVENLHLRNDVWRWLSWK